MKNGVTHHGIPFLFISIYFRTYPSMNLKSFYLMIGSYMKYNPSALGQYFFFLILSFFISFRLGQYFLK